MYKKEDNLYAMCTHMLIHHRWSHGPILVLEDVNVCIFLSFFYMYVLAWMLEVVRRQTLHSPTHWSQDDEAYMSNSPRVC